MEGLIKADGHRDVLTAESGEKALSLLAHGLGIQLDLIILDIHLPKIDGIESCSRIRNDAVPNYPDRDNYCARRYENSR